jgi:hypothetical protein
MVLTEIAIFKKAVLAPIYSKTLADELDNDSGSKPNTAVLNKREALKTFDQAETDFLKKNGK